MAETKMTMERLNDSNWASWKFRMVLLLEKEGLWSVVNEAKPDSAAATWVTKDGAARATIELALDDSQLSHVMGAVTAYDMWTKLKGYHERGSLTNKIHALRKLCSVRLIENGNMSDHLAEITLLVHKLLGMGEKLEEHWIVAILLSSLPNSYNPLITALEGHPEADTKMEYVKGKLLDEWRRRCEGQEQKVMKTTVRLEERRGVVRTCYYCKKVGHLRRNCPLLLAERQAKVNEERNQAKMVVKKKQADPSSCGSTRGVCFTTTTGSDVSTGGRWIIDTGCSRHMTGSTMSFHRMTFSEEEILLADGRTVTSRGTGHGTIAGAGLDGDEPVDMQLKELLYVPGLSGSVLSVSRITSQGYDVLFGAKDCRILEGSNVVAVGDRIGGLYYLRQPVET